MLVKSKDHRVSKATLAHKATKVIQDRKDSLGTKVRKVFKVTLVLKAIKAHKAHRAIRASRAHKVIRELLLFGTLLGHTAEELLTLLVTLRHTTGRLGIGLTPMVAMSVTLQVRGHSGRCLPTKAPKGRRAFKATKA
jgi:2-methylaconitate cis-trans-isomerase PrpF